MHGFVGREHVLAAGRAVLAEAVSGQGRLLLVSGEPGVGKTALAGRLLREAPGLSVWVSCRQGDGTPPFWPWVQFLRAVGAGSVLDDVHDGSPESARFHLFDGLARALVRAGADRPLAVVLDDLHWSDESSLQALRFAAEQIRTAPVLILGTYREEEAGPTLLDLARSAQVVRLTGLDEGEVAELLERIAGCPPDPEVAREMARRTGGNPFFVREMAHLAFHRHGHVKPLPEPVRETLLRRIMMLPPRCAALLGVASVIGREFAVHVLARAASEPVDETAVLLDEATRHMVLDRHADGRYRFVHDLYREAVYADIETARRAALHLAVARALAVSRETGDLVPVAEIASHFCEASAVGGADEAVGYARAAAREASARLAFEDACSHYERALGVLPLATMAGTGTRLSLLLEVADVRYRCGWTDASRDAFLHAADVARSCGEVEGLAQAAIGLHLLGARSGRPDLRTLALLEESAKLLPEGPLRARVLAALARDLHHSLDGQAIERAKAVAEESVALARSLDDPGTLALCLLALHDAHWAAGTAAERLPVAEEMIVLAARAGDRETAAQARLLEATALLELGDPRGRGVLDAYCREAEGLGHARARWGAITRRATIALISGRLDEAEQLVDAGAALGEQVGEPDAYGVAAVQAWVLSRFGRKRQDHIDLCIEVYGELGHPPFVAASLLGKGDRVGAAAVLAGYSLAELPWSHDPEPLVHLAVAVAEVGTERQRRETYERLAPLAGTGAVVGGSAAYLGAVDEYLGRLAESLGRPEAATAHYEVALSIYERLDAPAYADAVRKRLQGPSRGVFRRDGKTWTLSFGGSTVEIADAKGLHDIAFLLSVPGREIHVQELVGLRPAGADPVLDDQAREAYRTRLAALDAEIRDAETVEELERARSEREFLIEELSAATGLAGRARRLGDETERLRKTVTARIRKAVTRIGQVHPALAAHLTEALRTGTHCGYFPSAEVSWDVHGRAAAYFAQFGR